MQFWTDSALLEIYISAARVPQINKYNRIEKYLLIPVFVIQHWKEHTF
jgi:hypothetical protein